MTSIIKEGKARGEDYGQRSSCRPPYRLENIPIPESCSVISHVLTQARACTSQSTNHQTLTNLLHIGQLDHLSTAACCKLQTCASAHAIVASSTSNSLLDIVWWLIDLGQLLEQHEFQVQDVPEDTMDIQLEDTDTAIMVMTGGGTGLTLNDV